MDGILGLNFEKIGFNFSTIDDFRLLTFSKLLKLKSQEDFESLFVIFLDVIENNSHLLIDEIKFQKALIIVDFAEIS